MYGPSHFAQICSLDLGWPPQKMQLFGSSFMADTPEETAEEGDTARCRDDLMLKLAKLKPMTNAELLAKQRAEKAASGGKIRTRTEARAQVGSSSVNRYAAYLTGRPRELATKSRPCKQSCLLK